MTICKSNHNKRLSWSWSYGSWICNYLCNQCTSPLKLWVRTPLRRSILDTTLCNNVCQWHATGRWFSPGTTVSSTNKTDQRDITEILLKVALNTVNITKSQYINELILLNQHILGSLYIIKDQVDNTITSIH